MILNRTVTVYLTGPEFRAIAAEAGENGMTASAWIRFRLTGERPAARRPSKPGFVSGGSGMESPCHGCGDRSVTCHQTCPRYSLYLGAVKAVGEETKRRTAAERLAIPERMK